MAARLHAEGGAGPDLVLIHGFGADRLGWGATAPAFQATHRVWTLELPWHGLAGPGATDPEGMAAEAAVALAALGPRVALVGHSLGGAIAALLAAGDPGRFGPVVLIAPGGLGAGLDPDFLTGFAKLETGEQALAHLRRLVVRERLITPGMAQHVLAGLAVAGSRAALADIATALLAAPSPPFPVGAHVIWGAEDKINPHDPLSVADWGDRFTLLPDTGHLPQVEAVAKVNKIIAGVLAEG